jgi:1-acyl-sn-glycerol-3-phosphate acyltransferase
MNFATLIFNSFGWKVENSLPNGIPPKAVIIAAPHTSLIDFPIGFLTYKALGVKAHYLIKKEAFFFPFGILLKKWGGIPVDRYRKNTVVEDVVTHFKNSKQFILTVTPEGTRAKAKQWKNGYHRIATAAKVPVIIGFCDFKTKTVGVRAVYELQGDSDFDTLQIQKYYVGMQGRHPELFYLPEEAFH